MQTIQTILLRSATAAALAASLAATPAHADVCGCAGHPGSLGAFDSANADTWPTVGGRATTLSGSTITMPLPDDGVLVFDSFQVSDLPGGGNATVVFARDRANAPVRLLVAGDVRVGSGDVVSVGGTNGATATSTAGPGRGGIGGPGGHKGGDGGAPFFNEQTLGGWGFGPGGGAPGIVSAPSTRNQGEPGSFGGAPDLLPLAGGSGGGGSSTTYDSGSAAGGGGGGGGGAILIAANGTVTIDGTVRANGGSGGNHITSTTGLPGGAGSGGAIRRRAVRGVGAGVLSAVGGPNVSSGSGEGGAGRIRIEAIANAFPAASSNPVAFTAAAPGPLESPLAPQVAITEVGGAAVVQPPIGFGGSLGSVDVVVPAPGLVPVEVETRFVPGGTVVDFTVKPRFGVTTPFEASATLGACDAAGTCTAVADFTLDPGDYVIEAEATFAVP